MRELRLEVQRLGCDEPRRLPGVHQHREDHAEVSDAREVWRKPERDRIADDELDAQHAAVRHAVVNPDKRRGALTVEREAVDPGSTAGGAVRVDAQELVVQENQTRWLYAVDEV